MENGAPYAGWSRFVSRAFRAWRSPGRRPTEHSTIPGTGKDLRARSLRRPAGGLQALAQIRRAPAESRLRIRGVSREPSRPRPPPRARRARESSAREFLIETLDRTLGHVGLAERIGVMARISEEFELGFEPSAIVGEHEWRSSPWRTCAARMSKFVAVASTSDILPGSARAFIVGGSRGRRLQRRRNVSRDRKRLSSSGWSARRGVGRRERGDVSPGTLGASTSGTAA